MNKKLRQLWPDPYMNSAPLYHYVHTNADNFTYQYDLIEGRIEQGYENMRGVMKVVLKDHIDYWEILQEGLIREASKQLGIDANMNPDDFLVLFNQHYNSIVNKNSLSTKLYEWKKITNSVVSVQNSMRNATTKAQKDKAMKKYADVTMKNLKPIMKILVDIYNSESLLDRKWARFMGEKGITINDAMPNISKAKSAIMNLLKSLNLIDSDFASDKDIGKETLSKILTTIKSYETNIAPLSKGETINSKDVISRFYTINMRTQMGLFLDGDDIMKGFAGLFGSLLEDYTAQEVIYARKGKGKKSIDLVKDINIGSKMKHKTVSDVINYEWEYEGKTIKAGTSLKLTRFPGLTGKTYNVVDLVKTKYMSTIVGGKDTATASSSSLKTIQWLRMNLQALQVADIGGGAGLSAGLVEKFLRYEKELAAISTLPRLLDGVYDYQSKNVQLETNGDNIYWTAFINVRGNYIWIVDIMKQLYNLIASGGSFTSASYLIEVKGSQRTPIGMTAKDAWNLWSEKRRTIKALDDIVSYQNIYSGMADKFESLYNNSKLSSSPYSSITMDLKLGHMKGQLGIK